MKIVGAILNSLFQCDERMIEAGIFTKEQFQAGREDFWTAWRVYLNARVR